MAAGVVRLSLARVSCLLSTHKLSSHHLSLYCHHLACYGDNVLRLNAFSHIASLDEIIEQSLLSDERTKSKTRLSALDGVPISIKANIAVRGWPLTAGSAILGESVFDHDVHLEGDVENEHNSISKNQQKRQSCGYDSDVAHRLLRKSGAILVGLTNMDEFGMGSLGINCVGNDRFTKNPLPYLQRNDYDFYISLSSEEQDDYWIEKIHNATSQPETQENDINLQKTTYSAGGSSSGSAASVAHGSSLASIGTDTGGSVRLPSSWCGVVGLKPTYGLISRHGVVSYASSLDTVGILAPTVSCATMVFDCLVNRSGEGASNGSRDSTSVCHKSSRLPLCDATMSSSTFASKHKCEKFPLREITVGIPAAFSVKECPPDIQRAWIEAGRKLHEHGATVRVVPSSVISPEKAS